MIISVTKFELSSWRRYPEFFRLTYRVVRQVRESNGIIRLRINPLSLHTITAWETREDMLSFRNQGPHLAAMQQSRAFGKIYSKTWEAENIPKWQTAIIELEQ